MENLYSYYGNTQKKRLRPNFSLKHLLLFTSVNVNKSFTSMFDLGPLSGPECPGTSRQTAPDASSGVLPIARWHHVAGYGTRPDPQAGPLQCWSFLVPVNENIILMIFDILRTDTGGCSVIRTSPGF